LLRFFVNRNDGGTEENSGLLTQPFDNDLARFANTRHYKETGAVGLGGMHHPFGGYPNDPLVLKERSTPDSRHGLKHMAALCVG